MSLFWKRDQPSVDRRQSLAAVPVLAAGVRTETLGAGGLALRVAVARGAGWFSRFRPAVDSRRYELDAFGAFVVRQIDGRRPVTEIMDRFRDQFGMSRRESELGVVAFIKMLLQRRLVVVYAPESVPVPSESTP